MFNKIYLILYLFFIWGLRTEALTVPNSSVSTFSPEQPSSKTESIWIRPGVSFETVELENKKKVHNTGYSGYIGYDSDVISINKNWDMIMTLYAGYTGSRQTYNARSIIQNGGQIGLSGMFFKKNFFTGFSGTVGATTAEAQSRTENQSLNFAMLNAIGALKTGYNFDLFEKKITFQPSFLIAYLFVNTFDYINTDNTIVKSDPLHSIQLMPGVKFTGNLDKGFQPYFGIQTVWNIINVFDFSANDASIGEISVKPYVQYGLGIQKSVDEDYSAYIQSTLRNGGRNGIIFSFGLRRYF